MTHEIEVYEVIVYIFKYSVIPFCIGLAINVVFQFLRMIIKELMREE